jgi:hypothetical protein
MEDIKNGGGVEVSKELRDRVWIGLDEQHHFSQFKKGKSEKNNPQDEKAII